MYEIYQTIEGRKKTFLVFDGKEKPDAVFTAAKKYFRVAEHHLAITTCWILNDELYFEDPHDKKAKKMVALYWNK